MKAILTVIGPDCIGMISSVSTVLAENNVNILDISQTRLDEFITMTMILEISNMKVDFAELNARMKATGDKLGVVINIQHEDIFYSMHRI